MQQLEFGAMMSGTVRALTGTCPVKEWSKHMRRLLGVDKDCFTLGDTALLVCETAKALQSLGFTVPRHDLHLLPVFMTELAAPAEPHCYPCWQLHHRWPSSRLATKKARGPERLRRWTDISLQRDPHGIGGHMYAGAAKLSHPCLCSSSAGAGFS